MIIEKQNFIRRFDNHNDYESFTGSTSYTEPNVSLCEAENEVHYNPIVPSDEYVDLGLPSGTLWGTKNAGATSTTDYGNRYQYGKGANTYQTTSGETDYEGQENPLAASADTATQIWGDNWHMPTKAQADELIANTTYEFTTINGVNGGKFTGTNGKYIFIPAAGLINSGNLEGVGSFGEYWLSNCAYSLGRSLSLDRFGVNTDGASHRNLGYSVLGVIG